MFTRLHMLSAKAKIVWGIAGAVVVSAGGAGVYTVLNKPEEQVKKPAVKKTVKVKTQTEKVEIPSYGTEGSLSGESIEKDLTIFLKDTQGQKITGVPYEVKLVSSSDKKSLNDALDQINKVNTEIQEAQDDGSASDPYDPSEEESEETKDTEDKATETPASEETETKSTASPEPSEKADKKEEQIAVHADGTETPMTKGDALLVDKKKAIDAYAEVLNGIDGKSYTDDDQDGMITIDSIDAGDYTMCLVPSESVDTNSYATDVNVKDKVEYKPIENIEEKTVSAAAAGDVKPSSNTAAKADNSVPAVTDTVKFVNSRTEEETTYVQDQAQAFAPYVQGNTAVLYGVDGKNSMNIPVSVNSTGSVLTASSDNNMITIVTVSADAGNIAIHAADSANDYSGNITIEYIDSSTSSVTVSVKGSSNKLTNSAGEQLYVDAAGTAPATLANYTQAVYKKQIINHYYGWQNFNGARYYYDENGNVVTGEQTIQGVKYKFGTDGQLLINGTGIDVSQWQGNIDWSQARTAVSFMIARAGFRGTSGRMAKDPTFLRNIAGAKANGVTTGAYFYSIAKNEAQAVEEASLAIEQVRAAGGVSLPIFIDMEDSGQAGLSNAERTAIVNAFCNTVRAAGYTPGLYASKSWLTSKINTGSLNCMIWCAQWNTKCTYTGNYGIWQYSNKGTIPGISGAVDMNASYF
ncbi:MAG: GH25 family lysozyme [Erysipelotrichaceae bacterium]|nr:GH25 family lysozyme [Erysipelotrichaceae bacterium]